MSRLVTFNASAGWLVLFMFLVLLLLVAAALLWLICALVIGSVQLARRAIGGDQWGDR